MSERGIKNTHYWGFFRVVDKSTFALLTYVIMKAVVLFVIVIAMAILSADLETVIAPPPAEQQPTGAYSPVEFDTTRPSVTHYEMRPRNVARI